MQFTLLIALVMSSSLLFPPELKASDPFDEMTLRGRLTREERKAFSYNKLFMSDEERKEYLSIKEVNGREKWLESFWKQLDPTPTTERNELRLEVLERIKLAGELFGSDTYPGWDARGNVFIRYGIPAVKKRVWGTVSGRTISLPGEMWMYSSPDTVIYFIDRDLTGRYTVITWKSEPGDASPWTVRSAGGLFRSEAKTPLAPPSEDYPVSLDLADMELDNVGTTDVLKDLVDLVSEKYGLEGYCPRGTERSFFLFPDLDLNMRAFFDVLAFRGGEGVLRTEIAMEVPVSQVALDNSGGILKADVELRVLVLDTELSEIASKEEIFSLRSTEDETVTRTKTLLGQVVLSLPPAPYHIWIEAVDLISGRRGVLKMRKWLVPLDGGLCASDVQFAKTIAESSVPSRYMKNNLVVIPHPLHLYRIPFPITLYFEIYGLKQDKEDHVFYSIEYEIIPLKPGRNTMIEDRSKTMTAGFETSAFGPNQPVQFQIATDNLEEGPHRLKVRIMDRKTRETIEKTARFGLMK